MIPILYCALVTLSEKHGAFDPNMQVIIKNNYLSLKCLVIFPIHKNVCIHTGGIIV